MIEQMRTLLLRRWLWFSLTPFGLVSITQASRECGTLPRLTTGISDLAAAVLLTLAAAAGIALPMLYRVLFAHAHRSAASVSIDALYRYENNSIILASMTTWCLLLTLLLDAPDLFVFGALLLAMYAAYIHYPTPAKLTADARMFRVRE